GTWSVVKLEMDGKPVPAGEVDISKAKIVIAGDKFTLVLGDEKPRTMVLRLAPDKSPKQLDMITVDPMEKGAPPLPGIYELDGDRLRLGRASYAWTQSSDRKSGKPISEPKYEVGPRPKAFDSKGGSILIELKRDKP